MIFVGLLSDLDKTRIVNEVFEDYAEILCERQLITWGKRLTDDERFEYYNIEPVVFPKFDRFVVIRYLGLFDEKGRLLFIAHIDKQVRKGETIFFSVGNIAIEQRITYLDWLVDQGNRR